MDAETISKKEASSESRVKYYLAGIFFCGLLFVSLQMYAQEAMERNVTEEQIDIYRNRNRDAFKV